MKKKSFFLLEILVSLSLLATLLLTLFHFLTQIYTLEKKIDQTREELFWRQNFQFRLSHLFSHLAPHPEKASLHTKIFPEERMQSLVFFFDQGIDPAPALSGQIFARLFLDKKDLCLTLFSIEPVSKKKIFRKERLVSNVSSCQFFFLGKKNLWVSSLKETEKSFCPPIVKILIEKDDAVIEFAFFPLLEDVLIPYDVSI